MGQSQNPKHKNITYNRFGVRLCFQTADLEKSQRRLSKGRADDRGE
eukprot:COSAG06_NODE_60028_length_272_cov_0.618497_1_plen_45_part_10